MLLDSVGQEFRWSQQSWLVTTAYGASVAWTSPALGKTYTNGGVIVLWSLCHSHVRLLGCIIQGLGSQTESHLPVAMGGVGFTAGLWGSERGVPRKGTYWQTMFWKEPERSLRNLESASVTLILLSPCRHKFAQFQWLDVDSTSQWEECERNGDHFILSSLNPIDHLQKWPQQFFSLDPPSAVVPSLNDIRLGWEIYFGHWETVHKYGAFTDLKIGSVLGLVLSCLGNSLITFMCMNSVSQLDDERLMEWTSRHMSWEHLWSPAGSQPGLDQKNLQTNSDSWVNKWYWSKLVVWGLKVQWKGK